MPATYHVAKTGSDTNPGGENSPFLTIGAAAEAARPGDTVIVHAGEYREWVKPREGGLSDNRRITYRAAEGERPVIKGSERVQGWERVKEFVWRAEVDNALFGGWNPFARPVTGDWLYAPTDRTMHLGDVYLNGMSFYEAETLEELYGPEIRREILDNWTQEIVPVANPEQTKYLWYAEVKEKITVIWANFHGADPNNELTEINVRRSCFYPDKNGVNYITVKGFEMAHAASPWAPPTADQPAMLGPNWAKGWIIEGNILHDAKCSAISIGKEAATGDNYRTARGDKPGYQYQLESVFSARKIGWSKEKIGSHIIRNNVIYDCGQTGVVGHLGCAFSEICGNHIYNIALKREFYGAEIAGIKLHAAIDAHIYGNRIHGCSLGLWLDWQTQGTRISQNLFYGNNRDLFIEVSHGPYTVDHNILASKYFLDNFSQGGAYVGNLIAGKTNQKKILNRATPYHAPHSTELAGYAMVYGADDRLYRNIFIGGAAAGAVGTANYDGCTASLEEYMSAVAKGGLGDLPLFEPVEQPAYVDDNVYLNGARPFDRDEHRLELSGFDPGLAVAEENGAVFLELTLPEAFAGFTSAPRGTDSLPRVRIVDAEFESPDGSPLELDRDYFGEEIADLSVAGPIAGLKAGANRVKVWG